MSRTQKADPVSESANPSSQHQLYGSIVPIWTERRKIDLGFLLVIRLRCISPSAYYLHKMLQEQRKHPHEIDALPAKHPHKIVQPH